METLIILSALVPPPEYYTYIDLISPYILDLVDEYQQYQEATVDDDDDEEEEDYEYSNE